MTDLIATLEGLTGPSREVDALIHTATNAPLRELMKEVG